MKNLFNIPSNRKGFTLVEFLLVISVMGLLTSTVLVNLRGAGEQADLARRTRDAATSNRSLVCGEGQMMDLDGNFYNTIEIAGLCWMRENLKYLPSVSRPSMGSSINPVYYVPGYDGTSIEEAKMTENFQRYGVLYNWPAAIQACPPGTRLPTDAELHLLERKFATGTCNPNRSGTPFECNPAGRRLKASSLDSPSWDGDNASGFSALPAGFRYQANEFVGFSYINTDGFFWSSTEPDVNSAWLRGLSSRHSNNEVLRGAAHKSWAYSVRCVQ